MEKLKDTWEALIQQVATDIILRKFSEITYDEDWDEGTAQGAGHAIAARVKYDLTERELTELGEDMFLDAVIVIRMIDLNALALDIAAQDRFTIAGKPYRITKIRPRFVAGIKVGYEIGIREEMAPLPDPPPPPPPGGN